MNISIYLYRSSIDEMLEVGKFSFSKEEFRIYPPESSLEILYDWMYKRGLEQAILNARNIKFFP